MDKPKTTPKDFFLWAGAMIALYWSAIAFIFLIFDYINYSWPNPLSYLPSNPYDSGIGIEMASVIVLFPLYLVLMWIIRRDIARDASRQDIWVRRWALILTLFVAGATVAGDMISLLTAFLSGDALTTAFLVKTAVLLLVAALAFMHFIADYWGYWMQYPSRQRMVAWGSGIMIVAVVIIGFVLFGTPQAARQYRYDEQRVSDLQSIQSQITYYYQAKQKLPANLADLTDSISGYKAPVDPQSGQQYDYHVTTAPYSFELCAQFASASVGEQTQYAGQPPVPVTVHQGGDSWAHGAGTQCFERTIDPELYPPIKNAR